MTVAYYLLLHGKYSANKRRTSSLSTCPRTGIMELTAAAMIWGHVRPHSSCKTFTSLTVSCPGCFTYFCGCCQIYNTAEDLGKSGCLYLLMRWVVLMSSTGTSSSDWSLTQPVHHSLHPHHDVEDRGPGAIRHQGLLEEAVWGCCEGCVCRATSPTTPSAPAAVASVPSSRPCRRSRSTRGSRHLYRDKRANIVLYFVVQIVLTFILKF